MLAEQIVPKLDVVIVHYDDEPASVSYLPHMLWMQLRNIVGSCSIEDSNTEDAFTIAFDRDGVQVRIYYSILTTGTEVLTLQSKVRSRGTLYILDRANYREGVADAGYLLYNELKRADSQANVIIYTAFPDDQSSRLVDDADAPIICSKMDRAQLIKLLISHIYRVSTHVIATPDSN